MHFSWTFNLPNQTLDIIAVFASVVVFAFVVGYVGREIYRHYKDKK